MKPTDFLSVWPILIAVLIGQIPIFGLVIWFMRRGPDDAIRTIRIDVDGIGVKADEMRREHDADREKLGALLVANGQSEQDRQQIRDRLSKVEATVVSLERQIVGQQRDIMDAIQSSSLAQLSAVHEAKIEIARLGERANIAEALTDLGERFERTLKDLALERDTGRRQ